MFVAQHVVLANPLTSMEKTQEHAKQLHSETGSVPISAVSQEGGARGENLEGCFGSLLARVHIPSLKGFEIGTLALGIGKNTGKPFHVSRLGASQAVQ